MKKYIKIFAPILLGIFFIYLTIKITSPDERALIWSYIRSAKIEFIIAAMLFGAFADFIRGLRWRFLAKAVGHSSNPLISIASVFMCYSSNLIITRSGEILRATVLSGYNNIPLGKFANLDDVATTVAFLASDASSMITGTSILVDGGWTAK